MPSDCQCSACGACEPKIIEKKIGDKEAIRIIEELEKNNRILEEENKSLLEESKRNKIDKDEIIRELLKKIKEL